MWFLLWSGVFERFPGLRFGVTEAGAWWMPGLLWFWDRLYLGQKGSEKLGARPFGDNVQMRPSEYFDRNCFIGASNTKRREIGMRYEIGVDNLLWGSDFPHPGGHLADARASGCKQDVPRRPDRRDPPDARPGRGRDLRLRPRRAAPTAEESPTPRARPARRRPAGADLVAKWAKTKEVGRHWLTGHDFPLADALAK